MAFNSFTTSTKIESAKMNENFSNIADGSEVNNVAWSSWTPTVTGFSGSPTVNGQWTQIGKTVFVRGYIDGTSNATSFTCTNLPVAPAQNHYGVCEVTKDNSAYAAEVGTLVILAGATTITFYPNNAHNASGWTAANNKVVGFNLVYEVS